jgi:hypothetical protein
MRTVSRHGKPVREPTYRTIHDKEAAEPDPMCFYCGAVPVTNPEDTCSPECEQLQLEADAREALERDQRALDRRTNQLIDKARDK